MNVSSPKKNDSIAIVLLFILSIPVFYFALFVPFETDTGDSIVHYYFARYSFQNPMLFLDHWAKPFFTLLASPFAQFGFAGMKLFNGLAGLLSAWFAYCIARKLNLRFAWLAIIFVIFSPTYFVNLFSGYTEPLFGLIVITSVYFIIAQRPSMAAVFLSFLPFVRSEGLLIIFIFGLYFLVVKNYKAIILLASGHFIYTIAGLISGKSFFWLFTEIPYQVVSVYGKGSFSHYPTQLFITLGVPLFFLFLAGILYLLIEVINPKSPVFAEKKLEVSMLILGSFLTYFLFHTFSWGMGLFGSMGMSRILNAIVPLGAIISLFGFNILVNWKIKPYHHLNLSFIIPVISYIVIFPFLNNPASIDRKKDLQRSPAMNLMHRISQEIRKENPDKFLYYSNPYLSYSLDINPFDTTKHLCFTDWQNQKTLKPNSLVIWDNWFSPVEERTDSLQLLANPELRLKKRYQTTDGDSKTVFLIFSN